MDNQSDNQTQLQGGKNRQITVKLAVVLLVAVFLIGLGSFWIINRLILGRATVQDLQINSEVIEKNALVAKATAELIRTQINKILLVGSYYSAKKDVAVLIENGKWAEALNQMSGVFKDTSGGTVERSILFDFSGILRAGAPVGIKEAVGQNFSSSDWYRGVTKSFKPYISEVYEREESPRFDVVGMAFPIFNDKGAPIAILLLQVKTDTFLVWLENTKVGISGLTFIVDQKGHIVAHPELPPQGAIVDYSSRADVQAVMAGKTSTHLILTSSNDRVVSSSEPISEFHWGIISSIKINELMKNGLSTQN